MTTQLNIPLGVLLTMTLVSCGSDGDSGSADTPHQLMVCLQSVM